jgi:hypothetical protein
MGLFDAYLTPDVPAWRGHGAALPQKQTSRPIRLCSVSSVPETWRPSSKQYLLILIQQSHGHSDAQHFASAYYGENLMDI